MQGSSATAETCMQGSSATAEVRRYAGQQVLVFSVLVYLCCQKQQAEWTAPSPEI